ncbi:MAG: CoA protein activase [Nitrospirae bacterium]|nr:CoA protein activase [Nitrospirota bacterium]
MNKHIGLDAGSVSVKLAVLDNDGNILDTKYIRHKGNPLSVSYDLLKQLPAGAFLSVTGSAGKLISQALGIGHINEVVALSYSTGKLYPEIRTVIEVGGEDSKLILLDNGAVKEFSMNSVCAAGTGSFLDQQAERLNLSIEEFSRITLKSAHPPRIAGRCSVFAKSDMIHLQQIATPVEDIVAGLCFAVARNFKGSICKNMKLPEPISLHGGVAANEGVRRAFREVLSVETLIIPEHYALMPAIGAALKDFEDGVKRSFDIKKLESLLIARSSDDENGCKPLCVDKEEFNNRHRVSYYIHKPETSEKIDAFLGIDIGSISTNLAVIDEEGRLLSKRYLMTAGRPIEAVRQGLDEVGLEVGDKVHIRGVGTTGSGRYMISDFVGADIVKNEITAQARAAIAIAPDVDTIFEIGGQDSKFISLRDSVIVDFEMNKACAAGTGSFLEEQAEKLDIAIKEEFAGLAFDSGTPCSLGERCTVFMESSLLSKQQRGLPKKDLVAGLSYSIVQNYINRVVDGRTIGNKIFFQGGTAFNKAIVAAFENYLDKKITVPPHHDVTGAIGMALIAREHMKNREHGTIFKSFDLSKRAYEIKSFECKGCDNICEINRVKIEGEDEPLFYGSRCEKYDVKRKKQENLAGMPDLFKEREELLLKSHREYSEKFNEETSGKSRRPRIGIPKIFFFHDYMPLWSTFLWELGFNVELSENTNRNIINQGVESILSESCFPHKVAHGHIKDLIERNLDAIFLPSFINFDDAGKKTRGFACPYAQTMPYLANIAFGIKEQSPYNPEKVRFLEPVINMEYGEGHLLKEMSRVLSPFKISLSAIRKALKKAETAQDDFESSVRKRGEEILKDLPERTIVIIGRSYNAFDSGINLEIPKKLSALGVFSIPMDFLSLDDITITDIWPNMYWKSGQKILKAAELIRDNPKLFPLYIGNFSCGPDSFIHRFFHEAMSDKPFLHIEIDEHSADAGAITRCEAFLDSITNRKDILFSQPKRVKTLSIKKGASKNRIVYIPRMSDHSFALAAAFETCGLEAEVMEISGADTVKIGRQHVSGKECYPCAVTTGDMVNKTRANDFNPERAAFFMPSGTGPCRFGQYNVMHRLVLDEIGLPQVPIFSPNQDETFYRELGIVGSDFAKNAWRGIIATEMLIKCLHETRPYEINAGETDSLYSEYLTKISRTVKSSNGTMPELLNVMREDFSLIKRDNRKKPLIGIIGEIFVRQNSFSNENIIEKIEALGGEVWLAPVEEWIYYVNLMSLRKAVTRVKNNPFSSDNASDILNICLTRFVQGRVDRKFSKPFKGFLKTLHEPSTSEILKNASPFLHDSFEGEAVLSMGKAVDFVKNGASGIICAMPFGCMPGTIVTALLKGLKQEAGIPCLSIAYDGSEAACSEMQLEAFMHQTTEHYRSQNSDKHPGSKH